MEQEQLTHYLHTISRREAIYKFLHCLEKGKIQQKLLK